MTTANGTEIVAATGEVVAERAISVFASFGAFEAAWKMAGALSRSTIVPKAYQGEDGRSNAMIAIELASRIGASVFMVMNSLDVIQGRPSWSAKFLIATVNASGRFSPIRFRWQGTQGNDDWGCRAVATDLKSGEECVGTLITIATAKAEGWYSRSGSKWLTIPEQMLQYRSAAFWSRIYCPEVGLGLMTSDELTDIAPVSEAPKQAPIAELEAKVRARSIAAAQDVVVAEVAEQIIAKEPEVSPAIPSTAKPVAAAKPKEENAGPGPVGPACAICGKPTGSAVVPTMLDGGKRGIRHVACSPFAGQARGPLTYQSDADEGPGIV